MAKTSKNNPLKASGTQSIHRVLSILKKVAQYNDTGVRLSQLSQELGLHTATAHRMLSILAREGWLSMDPNSKSYHLGYEIFSLGTQANQFKLKDLFHGVLEHIADQTGDTTYLVTRSGNDALCLDRIVGKFPVQVLTFEIGHQRPLGIGAGSLALLSAMPVDQAELIIKENEERYKIFNRTGEEVRSAVKQSRRLGYGLSVKTVTPDTVGVGVTVKNSDGQSVAAISVAGISKRMVPAKRNKIVKLIKAEIAKIDRGSLTGAKT
jgi:DNA-binding IclR family transcriptional regulator